MALAEKMGRLERCVEGSVAFPLPPIGRAERPEVRPNARQKNSRKAVVLIMAGWVAVIMISALLVHQNSLVQVEMAAITRAREELSTLQVQNRELQTNLVQSQSVGELERWAVARGMKRPASVRKLEGDPSAVVTRQSKQPTQPAAKGPLALLATVRDYLSRWMPVRSAADR